MKRKIIALFLALTFLVTAALASCSDDGENPAVPPETEDDGGVEDVRNELVNASLSDVIAMFRDAIAGGTGLEDITDGIRLSGSIPANKLLGTSETSLYMSDGIVTLLSGGSASYFAVVDGSITMVEDGEANDVLAGLGLSLDTEKIVTGLGYAVSISEEYFDLARITEDDIVEGEDGLFYLSDAYVRNAVEKVYTAIVLLAEGYEPEELATVPDELLGEMRARGEALADALTLELGFGLKMRRITSVRLSAAYDGMTELTDGQLESFKLAADLKLNTARDRLTDVSLELSAREKELGDVSFSLEATATYNSSGAPLVINARLDSSVESIELAKNDIASGDSVTVRGSRLVSLELGYNSRFSISGGSLMDLTVASSAEPKELLHSDDTSLTDEERSDLLDKKKYEREISVSFKMNESGGGIMPIAVKDGPLSASFSGIFEYGEKAANYDVPEDVREALGK